MNTTLFYRRGFWLGMLLVTAGITVVLAYSWQSLHLASAGENAIIFDPQFVSASRPRILPGASREFEVMLKNLTGSSVLIDERRFSHPSATGTIGGKINFPIRLPGHSSMPVHVNVKSSGQETGRGELRFGVVGRLGKRMVDAGALAELHFVQAINANPGVVSLGQVSTESPVREEVITLWVPKELEVPRSLFVESDDPCVMATIDRLPVDSVNRSTDFDVAKILIAVNPAKAPERLSARVTVKADMADIIIPVLGFFEKPCGGETAP